MDNHDRLSKHSQGLEDKLDAIIQQARRLKESVRRPSASGRREQLEELLQVAAEALGQIKAEPELVTTPVSGEADLSRQPMPMPETGALQQENISYLLKESPVILYKTSHQYPYPITYISENVERIMGYAPDELISNHDYWLEHLHPDDVKETNEYFPVLIARGGGRLEYRYRFADGTYHWLLEHFRLAHDQTGAVRGLVGCLIDITDKKWAEGQLEGLLKESQALNEALRASEEELLAGEEDLRQSLERTLELNEKLQESEWFTKSIVNAVKHGIVVLDQHLRCQVINPFMAQCFGVATHEVLGKQIFDLFPFLDTAGMLVLMEQALQGESQIMADTFLPGIGPEGLWVSASFSPFVNQQQGIIGVICTFSDITKRKRAEQALQEQKNLLQAFYDTGHMHMGVFELAKADFIFVLPNQYMAQLFKLPVEELKGKTASEVGMPAGMIDFWCNAFQSCLVAGQPMLLEFDYTTYAGKNRWYFCSFSPLHDNRVSFIAVDITDRKRAEQEKQQLLTHTQALNLELEVSQQKLVEQNENLKKINTELDNFVYRTSHDLRAPLASVLGLINVCRLDAEEHNKQVYLDLMEKSITKLDTFISDIINYSRNTRVEVQYQKIDLETLLKESLEGLKFMEGFELLEKKVEIDQRLPFYSDDFRLKIICNNLFSNAIKYRSSGTEVPYVLVKVQVNRQRALFEFKDNGIGIAQDKVDKIFDMFYRASETSKGSGLGLYIVREVVQALDGKIQVKSKPGVGTTFLVEIPNHGRTV